MRPNMKTIVTTSTSSTTASPTTITSDDAEYKYLQSVIQLHQRRIEELELSLKYQLTTNETLSQLSLDLLLSSLRFSNYRNLLQSGARKNDSELITLFENLSKNLPPKYRQ